MALALLLAAVLAPAQAPAENLRRSTGTARWVDIEQKQDRALSIQSGSARNKAMEFLRLRGAEFGIRDPDRELRERGSRTDAIGRARVSYGQVYRGIEVWGGELRAHLDPAGRLRIVNGTFAPISPDLDPAPRLSATEAEERAISAVAKPRALDPSELGSRNEGLRVFVVGLLQGHPGQSRLVYEVEVHNTPLTLRKIVFVDAHDGRIVEQIEGVQEVLGRRVWEGSTSNTVWLEGDPDPITAGWAGGNSQQVLDWQDEIDGARETYNLVGSTTGGSYLSFNGASATMSTLNNDPNINCPNAYWNGSFTGYCSGVTSDDIVAHEWAHGYTSYTSGLIYAWQSGAMNEAYSDIYGEVVDLKNGRGTDDVGFRSPDGSLCSDFMVPAPATGDPSRRWLLGEDATAFGGAIRDMWRPECRSDPGRVGSAAYWCSSGDNGGVHINSGVVNHTFALLADGGTYNGETISGIGLDRAFHVFWRAQNTYLVSTSDFHDLALALEASCADLVGVALVEPVTSDAASWGTAIDPITAADCEEVAAANRATELRAPAPCSFEPLLDPNTPDLCSSGDPAEFFFEDWEDGIGNWTAARRAVSNPSTFDTPDWAVVDTLPDGRTGKGAFAADLVIGNCSSDLETGVLFLESEDIMIPEGTSEPRLAIDHWVATEPYWDGGNLKISVNGGAPTLVPGTAFEFNTYVGPLNPGPDNDNPLAGEDAFHGTNEGSLSGSWGRSLISLTALAAAGDSIRIRFELGLDGCNGRIGWYLDETRLYGCAAEPTPTPSPTPAPTPSPTPTPTPTPSPTPTPVPTPTPAPTPTPVPTPTPTPTPSPSPGPVCGNGVIEPGETCDAGSDNGTGRSCCAADCQFKPDGPQSCDGSICTAGDSCSAGVCTPGECNVGGACAFCGTSRCAVVDGECGCGL